MRVSRDGGRRYPRTTERPVTDQPPSAPAALRIYDRDGTTRCFVADFDAKGARGSELVSREAAAFAELVERCGGVSISDISPSGGRHVYVPLARPVPWALARRIAHQLQERYHTFDKAPMCGLTDGLIRPPGSAHPAGGFQVLTSSQEHTQRALTVRTSTAAFTELALAVGVDPEAPAPAISPVGGDVWLNAMEAPAMAGRRRRRLPAEWQLMATKGTWPRSWPSNSEARLALLRACARFGWVFADVVSRFESGAWPAFVALYARLGPRHVRGALARDWHKALKPVPLKTTTSVSGESSTRKIDMKAPLHTPLPGDVGEYAQIRDWWTMVHQLERSRWQGRAGLSIRRVLRALGAAAQMTGSTRVAFGLRSLATGAGLDHSTVHNVLRQLRSEPAAVVVRLGEAQGLEAELYELTVPEEHEELTRTAWRTGKIRTVHPIFRHLGGAGFLVWEVLAGAGPAAVSTFDISAQTGVPARSVQEVLVELGEVGLAERSAGGWVASGDIDAVSEELGATERHRQVLAEHRRDREVWREFIAGQLPEVLRRWWQEEPPPEPEWSQVAVS